MVTVLRNRSVKGLAVVASVATALALQPGLAGSQQAQPSRPPGQSGAVQSQRQELQAEMQRLREEFHRRMEDLKRECQEKRRALEEEFKQKRQALRERFPAGGGQAPRAR